MANVVLVPELSWLLTLICFAILVLLIAMCVCSKQSEKEYFQGKTHDYGTAGRLSMTRDSPIFQHRTTNGITSTAKATDTENVEEDGTTKRNSWTVKDRALPDIPDGNIPNPTEEKPTSVEETNQGKKKTHTKSVAPKPPTNDSTIVEVPPDHSTSKDSPHVVKITVNDKVKDSSKPSTSSFNARSWTQELDGLPGTSNGSVTLTKVSSSGNDRYPNRRSESDAYDGSMNPYAEPHTEPIRPFSSPVCIRIGLPENSDEQPSQITPAGLAVAGAVPSSDIPYMTPPLHHNQPSSSEDSPQRNSNHRSEVPYTVISVREPLARVREMTRRKQRTIQQNSVEGENHYSMVPEEEQMYAEIGSGQDSASSSITYAHIEPRELPPVPPTVESLKSVAHAHSRQASTVSNSSFGSCMSGSVESTSPTQLRNPSSSLYSSVEKNAKQRRTIHIAEGASALSSGDKHKKVEDLYARVRKKRVELTLSASSSEDYPSYQGITGEDSCMTPPPSPWASTTPPAPPPITGRLQAASLGVLSTGPNRRHSAEPNLNEKVKEVVVENKHFSHPATSTNANEPGYEQIYNDSNNNDSCYEKIKDESLTGSDGKAGYESIGQADDNGFSFPGYASVDKDSSDPGYECVAQMDSMISDPGYEPVRISLNMETSNYLNHGYTTVNLDDDNEPNYETVNKVYRAGSDAVDPGYEKVKKLSRNDSDATDPGYERVRGNTDETGDPGYETVHRTELDNDPSYEVVKPHKTLSNATKRPNDNAANRGHKSTILFVSGNTHSRGISSGNESLSKEDDQELNATFL